MSYTRFSEVSAEKLKSKSLVTEWTSFWIILNWVDEAKGAVVFVLPIFRIKAGKLPFISAEGEFLLDAQSQHRRTLSEPSIG